LASAFPFLLGLIIIIIGGYRLYKITIQQEEQEEEEEEIKNERKEQIKSQHSWGLLFLSYLVLPPVIGIQSKALNCFTLTSGESYLWSDSSINCSSQKHIRFQIIDSFLICIYLSIILLWIILLYQKRYLLFPSPTSLKFINDEEIIQFRRLQPSLRPLSFLFERYKPNNSMT